MNTLDEHIPVYLERYTAELGDWPRDIRNVRAHQSVPETLNAHPKDRTLFARIDAVLREYDRAKRASVLGTHTGHGSADPDRHTDMANRSPSRSRKEQR